MPHRVAYFGIMKVAAGVSGLLGSGVTLVAMDPDHAKALIVAIGGGSLAVLYFGLKELVPVYVSARKQIRQMNIDLATMGEQVGSTAVKVEDTAAQVVELTRDKEQAVALAATANAEAERVARHAAQARQEAAKLSAQMEILNRDNAELRAQMETLKRENAEKRHDLANRVTDAIVQHQDDLQQARAEIDRLNARLAEHVPAINTISESVSEIAAHMRPPVPVPTPHLAPSEDKPDSRHNLPVRQETP